jgi:hypothetical protein
MTFLSWIIIIGLIGVGGLWLTRQWEARQQAKQTADMAATTPDATLEPNTLATLPSPTVVLRNGFANLKTTLRGAPQLPLAPKFRAWMALALNAEPALNSWLSTLSDEQMNVLAHHIDAFAHEMGFELTWLLDQEMAQYPALTKALTSVVVDYCQACRQSVIIQEELEAFRVLRQYLLNPNSTQNREFGQALFGKLLEQGVVPIKVADHLALPDRERRQQIATAIQQAAREKHGTLQRILKDLLTQRNGLAAAPVTTVSLNGATSEAQP